METGTQSTQQEMFALDAIEGYGVLTRRERLFAEALFEGKTQREAAIAAGYEGNQETLDVSASRLVRSVKIRRLMNQAWTRSGASIDRTLQQAAELQQQAFLEATTAENRDTRMEAFKKWKDASTLIASIHGKLTLNVKNDVTLQAPGMLMIPVSALDTLAQIRREVEVIDAGPTTGGRS